MIQILEIKEKAMNWEYYGSLLLRILLTLKFMISRNHI